MPTRRPSSHPLASIAVGLAMLGSLLVLPASTIAATPSWETVPTPGYADAIPATISPGKAAGYGATIHNIGPSNISQLYADATFAQLGTAAADAVYAEAFIKGTGATDNFVKVDNACTLGVRVTCIFGSLRAGEYARLIVAYNTSGSSDATATFTWQTTGLGSTQCDPTTTGDNSHGDCLTQSATTTFNGTGDFSGGFTTAAAAEYATSDPVGPNDAFAASVKGPSQAYIPITIQDNAYYGACPEGFTCFAGTEDSSTPGQKVNAVALNVADGQVFTTPFKVVVQIYKDAVPAGANAKKLVVVHYIVGGPHDGDVQLIDNSCPKNGPPATVCRDVSWSGKTGIYTVTVYLLENGYMKFH